MNNLLRFVVITITAMEAAWKLYERIDTFLEQKARRKNPPLDSFWSKAQRKFLELIPQQKPIPEQKAQQNVSVKRTRNRSHRSS